MGREANALMEIEQERAKRRQAEQAKVNLKQGTKRTKCELVRTSGKKKKVRSSDVVGKKVGVSGRTAEKSAFCVQVMDALDRIGKTVEAHQIRQLLRKNVTKAYLLEEMKAGKDPRQYTGRGWRRESDTPTVPGLYSLYPPNHRNL